MKNFAGDWRCDDVIPGELVYAGIIPIHHVMQQAGEVPTHFTGELYGWTFIRAWTYWVAKGPPLPLKYASPLHALIGDEVRVDGDCGSPSPAHSVGVYHVDTEDGLAILAATIRKHQRDNA